MAKVSFTPANELYVTYEHDPKEKKSYPVAFETREQAEEDKILTKQCWPGMQISKVFTYELKNNLRKEEDK